MKQPRVVRFQHGGASAKLSIADPPDKNVLSSLYSQERGKGEAQAVMESVVRYADRYDLVVHLVARQFGDIHGLTDDQLVEFYGKFGFVRVGIFPPYRMVRHPSSSSTSLQE